MIVWGSASQGRMTLLLGPPGAGKTTLLKALAGKLQHSSLNVSILLEAGMHQHHDSCTRPCCST